MQDMGIFSVLKRLRVKQSVFTHHYRWMVLTAVKLSMSLFPTVLKYLPPGSRTSQRGDRRYPDIFDQYGGGGRHLQEKPVSNIFTF
jgi:hypothetical protein